jgi:alkaline phosphatase D
LFFSTQTFMPMHRRQFLQASAAGLLPLSALALAQEAMALAADAHASAPPRWLADPFALGVASGEPRPDSVLLWTRLYPGPARPGHSASDAEQNEHFQEKSGLSADSVCQVSYEIFKDESLRQKVSGGDVLTHAGRGWSVHARVQGLMPDRHYWYRFRCGNAVSPVGRTRTAPALDASPVALRLALASCQHYEQGYYAAHAEIAREDLDVVLFVGDYIYESSNPKLRLRPHTGSNPETLEAYRERHALYKLDADLRASHAAHPWICTWDDHEVQNDYAGDQNPSYTDPATFLLRRAAAYQAYFEHMPVWPGGPGGPYQRIHQQWAWGQLADLWTLDCRQYRSPQPCRDPFKGGGRVVLNCAERDEPQRTMLGMEQERWLAEGLAQSRGHWRLVGQSTQISSTSVATPLGRTVFTDGWDGYTAARTRLLQALAANDKGNAVTLGGDVHMNVAADLRLHSNDESSPVVASEIVGTSITSRGMGEKTLASILASNPDIRHARSDERGYTRVDVRRDALVATFRTTPFPAQPQAVLGTQATFRVESGRAGVQRV